MVSGYDNREKEIETEILQDFPVSLILFLIYLSEIFSKVSESNSLVISLFFVDKLGFIALGSSVKEIVKTLENFAKVVLEYGMLNVNIAKTEAVLFSELH